MIRKALIFAMSFFAVSVVSADTFTTRFNLCKPSLNSPTWGPKEWSNWDIEDGNMAGLGIPNVFSSTETFLGPVSFSQVVTASTTYSINSLTAEFAGYAIGAGTVPASGVNAGTLGNGVLISTFPSGLSISAANLSATYGVSSATGNITGDLTTGRILTSTVTSGSGPLNITSADSAGAGNDINITPGSFGAFQTPGNVNINLNSNFSKSLFNIYDDTHKILYYTGGDWVIGDPLGGVGGVALFAPNGIVISTNPSGVGRPANGDGLQIQTATAFFVLDGSVILGTTTSPAYWIKTEKCDYNGSNCTNGYIPISTNTAGLNATYTEQAGTATNVSGGSVSATTGVFTGNVTVATMTLNGPVNAPTAGTYGQVLTSSGTGNPPFWNTPSAGGASFWTAAPGTPTMLGASSFIVTGNYTSLFNKKVVVKWTESSVVREAMVSIPAAYTATVTTVTIVGDAMASIDAASLSYALIEAKTVNFAVAGSIGVTGTDMMNDWYADEPYRVFGADVYTGTAGITTNTTFDIKDNTVTMFTTKPTLATTVAASPAPFTADSHTSMALNDRISVDITAVQTTPAAVDAYVKLYVFPTKY